MVRLAASKDVPGRRPSRSCPISDSSCPRSSIVSPRSAIDLQIIDQRPSQIETPAAPMTPRACMAPANTTARRQAAARGSWPPRSAAAPARASRWWRWTASHRCPEGPKSYFAIVLGTGVCKGSSEASYGSDRATSDEHATTSPTRRLRRRALAERSHPAHTSHA